MIEKIGQYFIRLSLLSFDQAEEVLRIQTQQQSKKFGEIALELGYITKEDLEEYLSETVSNNINS